MFWEKFVDLCNEQNMSPNKVAEILHISSGSVTGWKKGAFPRSTTIKKLLVLQKKSVSCESL